LEELKLDLVKEKRIKLQADNMREFKFQVRNLDYFKAQLYKLKLQAKWVYEKLRPPLQFRKRWVQRHTVLRSLSTAWRILFSMSCSWSCHVGCRSNSTMPAPSQFFNTRMGTASSSRGNVFCA